MQTKQDIQKLLGSAGVMPNKRLGQHFLIDLNLMRLLINSAHIQPSDVVFEVGCGTGSFTEGLAKVAGRVVAVEYDDVLAKISTDRLAKFGNVTVVNADALESKNSICREVAERIEQAVDESGGRLMLVANLPYSVGASIMLNLIVGPIAADSMYVTVQKEVADRMVAGPGGKNYGILSIFMEAMGQAKIIRKLSPSVFWPRPQVESAMVSFARQKKKVQRIHDVGVFKEVVNLFMGHRRKMLKACVKFTEGDMDKIHNWHDIFSRAFVEPHHRPEDLGADDYIAIANLCNEQLI